MQHVGGVHITIQKFTLLYAAALLLMLPAQAQVPIKDLVNPSKRIPPAIELPVIRPPSPNARLIEAQKHVLPPPEYDHDYDGELTLLRTPSSTVSKACAQAVIKDRPPPLGCSQITSTLPPKRCTIWIVTDDELRGWDYNIVLRHEIAHCNGWKHDKDGKTLPPPPSLERKLEDWCAADPLLLMCLTRSPR